MQAGGVNFAVWLQTAKTNWTFSTSVITSEGRTLLHKIGHSDNSLHQATQSCNALALLQNAT